MKSPDSGGGGFGLLASFMARALRAAWTGGIALAIGLVGTAVWTMSTVRLYRSEAVVVFEVGVEAGAGRDTEGPRVVGGRLHDLLTTRPRLESLIKEMKLYRKLRDKKGMAEAVDEMRKHITFVNREGFSYRVSYDGDSRDIAKDVLDKLLASVIDDDNTRRAKEAEEAKHFLDTERQQADQDLKDREAALATFLTKHPQLAAETGVASAGSLIRAADRDRAGAVGGGEVASLELQAAQLEEQLAAATAGRRVGGKLVNPAADPQLTAAVQRTQADLAVARTDLAEKQLHLTNEHPDVKNALRRVTMAEAAARHAEQALAAWRPSPASETGGTPTAEDAGEGTRVAALRRALSAVKGQIAAMRGRSSVRAEVPKTSGSAVAIDTEWTRLNRDVSEAKERQGQLENKQFQAQLAATLVSGGQGGQLKIADPPFKPMHPVAGERMKIALLGVAASIILALVVIGVFAAFDDRLYAAQDIESFVEDGIVVVIPKVIPRLPAPTRDG
ncbi:MAG TPA: hypothetical protein VKQ32_05835 [Polyangia bacterium]|nr:hypothetical protein [Polyangia bacterium]